MGSLLLLQRRSSPSPGLASRVPAPRPGPSSLHSSHRPLTWTRAHRGFPLRKHPSRRAAAPVPLLFSAFSQKSHPPPALPQSQPPAQQACHPPPLSFFSSRSPSPPSRPAPAEPMPLRAASGPPRSTLVHPCLQGPGLCLVHDGAPSVQPRDGWAGFRHGGLGAYKDAVTDSSPATQKTPQGLWTSTSVPGSLVYLLMVAHGLGILLLQETRSRRY